MEGLGLDCKDALHYKNMMIITVITKVMTRDVETRREVFLKRTKFPLLIFFREMKDVPNKKEAKKNNIEKRITF